MYTYTVNDHYERITTKIWEASKKEDWNTFNECLQELKSLKIAAGNRVEYAKCALQGLAAQHINVSGSKLYNTTLAIEAFAIADEMMKAEGIE